MKRARFRIGQRTQLTTNLGGDLCNKPKAYVAATLWWMLLIFSNLIVFSNVIVITDTILQRYTHTLSVCLSLVILKWYNEIIKIEIELCQWETPLEFCWKTYMIALIFLKRGTFLWIILYFRIHSFRIKRFNKCKR